MAEPFVIKDMGISAIGLSMLKLAQTCTQWNKSSLAHCKEKGICCTSATVASAMGAGEVGPILSKVIPVASKLEKAPSIGQGEDIDHHNVCGNAKTV